MFPLTFVSLYSLVCWKHQKIKVAHHGSVCFNDENPDNLKYSATRSFKGLSTSVFPLNLLNSSNAISTQGALFVSTPFSSLIFSHLPKKIFGLPLS